MGWWLTAAQDLPVEPATDSSQSVIVALIATLGTVLVALITVGLPLLFRRARTSESPPVPDPVLGERVAVTAARQDDDRRTLAQLDRHVDGIGDQVDEQRRDLVELRRDVDDIFRHLGWR